MTKKNFAFLVCAVGVAALIGLFYWYSTSYMPKKKLQEEVSRELTDPESARFTSVEFLKNSEAIFGCGDVNARNRLGDYAGGRGFVSVVMLESGKSTVLFEPKVPEELLQDEWGRRLVQATLDGYKASAEGARKNYQEHKAKGDLQGLLSNVEPSGTGVERIMSIMNEEYEGSSDSLADLGSGFKNRAELLRSYSKWASGSIGEYFTIRAVVGCSMQ